MMTNDSSNSSTDDLNTEPDFDPDATIELSETEVDARKAGYAPVATLPETIGHYRILSLIGEGGMGSVYKAEQDSPRRKVALKVIKAGVASKNLLLRFEIEAQILGKLDHPGIATIFEAGTFDEGRGTQPFFAMEFVEGQLLTDYADSRKLGTRDRLALLAKIADAVQHAHQKGIIHRDLKPGNILVTEKGQIKILDFGVARATDADIQTATMQTDIGQLIGTIPYMSPEQASGNPDDLDTRSDVYALGVIAYELLTGQMPYDLKQKMIHEAVRVIREDEPKTLSAINKTFRGDVDIIVSKALIKEKKLRYQSASDLGSDIERYLSNEPIEARPPSTWYHLSKFSRRNKALVAGIAAVLIVSVVGALVSINFALGEAEQKRIAIQATASEAVQREAAVARAEEAEAARVRAEAAEAETSLRAQELEQVAEFQSSQLRGIDVEMMGNKLRQALLVAVPEEQRLGAERSVAGVNFTSLALGTLEENIFVRSIAAVNEQFEDQPLVQAQLLQTIAKTTQELGLLERAVEPQERALAIRREILGDDYQDTLTSISNMGGLLQSQGKLEEAESYWREALEGYRRVLGDEHPSTLNSINNMGVLLQAQGQLDKAKLFYREALASRRRVLGDDHQDTLTSINNIGTLLYSQGNLGEAEPYFREALTSSRRVLGVDHPDTLVSINNLGFLLNSLGKSEEAEPYFNEALASSRRVLGDEHPSTLNSLNNMGLLLRSMGKLDEAEPYWREALEGYLRVLGDDHTNSLTSIGNMGVLLRSQGKLDEAELYLREALEGHRRVLGDDHPGTLIWINNMGSLLDSQGKIDEAEPYYREALASSRRVLGDDHPDTLISIGNMGVLLRSQGKLDEAEPYYREALVSSRRVLGDDHPDTLISIGNMRALLDQQGRWSESEELRRLQVNNARRAEPEDGARLGSALVRLGINLIKQDRFADAEIALSECLEIRKRVMPEGYWLIWSTQSTLGETLAKQSKFVEAERLLVEAAEQINPPEAAQIRRQEAIQRVVNLYTAWHSAEPRNGYDMKAEQWQERLTNSD